MPRVGLVITIKNEESLIRQNLMYHHHTGAEHVYVYDDGATDSSLDRIQDLPFVTIRNSVSPDELKVDYPITYLTKKLQTHHTARQCLNVLHAKQLARDRGIDWLVSIDADELLLPHLTDRDRKLPELFLHLPNDVHEVHFPVLELLQTRPDFNEVFEEGTFFQSPRHTIPRKISDPLQKRVIKNHKLIGHTQGKAAVRTSSDLTPHTVHQFTSPDRTPHKRVAAGQLLHYNMYSYANFVNKFRNFKDHADTFIHDNQVDYLKRMWRDMVNSGEFTEEYLKQYYLDNLVLKPETLRKYSARSFWGLFPARVIEITLVREFFLNLRR